MTIFRSICFIVSVLWLVRVMVNFYEFIVLKHPFKEKNKYYIYTKKSVAYYSVYWLSMACIALYLIAYGTYYSETDYFFNYKEFMLVYLVAMSVFFLLQRKEQKMNLAYMSVVKDPAEFEKIIDTYTNNSVVMDLGELCESVAKGKSRIGGKPEVPAGFEWPVYEKKPLSFMAQINCEEASIYDKEELLPKTGILYFFYEMETMKWGFHPKDKGCARVFYFNDAVDQLETREFPENLVEEYRYPVREVSFGSEKSIANFGEIFPMGSLKDWNAYDDILESKGLLDVEHRIKLLGHADVIQNPMLLECELVTQGINCGDGVEWTEKYEKKYLDASKEWQLLFQMDTVEFDEKVMMFGDSGRLYYYIKKENLKAGALDKTWTILQCY